MAYQFLKPNTIVETFRTSKRYTEGLTDRFTEYERLAANKPHGSIPKEYPKTTDGTTASIIRKTPHRIIQQLPTGKVKSTTEDWLSVVAEFVYYDRIIPNANEDYALLQKCWQVVERFLTFGYCGTYAPFVDHGGYLCSDLRLVYWGDIFIQPGKLSDTDSNYVFVRSWWQTADIDALIKAQSKIDPKKRTWDVGALQKVKKEVTSKDEKSKTPAERAMQVNAEGGVELITGFQRGVGSDFITFHVSSGEIVRTKKNKDPRGEIPVSFAYGDIDGSNPFGRSVIELVGGLQNLIDSEMQMYQFNRALMLAPPLIKRGNFSKNKVKLAPNVIIDLGSSPDATLEPIKIDTTAIANFPNNYGLMKSQMLNLLASPDTSISSDVGNPGFSKTPQGVEASRANLSVDDNYVRKQFETWYERWSETAINTYFAEREGIEVLQLDEKTANKLRELAQEGKLNPAQLSDDNKIKINYSTATEELKFEVDASTSMKQDEAQQLQSLDSIVGFLAKTQVEQALPIDKKIELFNAFVRNSGIEDPEALSMNDKEKQEAVQRLAQPPEDTREYLNFNYKDAPEDVKREIEDKMGLKPSQMTSPATQALDIQAQQQQPKVTPEVMLKADQQAHTQEMDKAKLMHEQATNPAPMEPPKRALTAQDQKLVQVLQSMGTNEQQIGQALAMLHTGHSIEEIVQMLQQGVQ